MIDWSEIPDGDTWELFARDFLAELGFVIDVGPGRGADAGRDLVISEQIRGRLATKKFTWLVSCKHFAVSGKSVGPDVELNILDRMKQHAADGFLGFYSTMPSSGLIERLKQLAESGDIAAHAIFDSKKIEGHFADTGLSKLALRYFPASYDRMRPIQKFFGNYEPLKCEICHCDVLARSVRESFQAIILFASPKDDHTSISSVHVVCKGACDKKLEAQLWSRGLLTRWEDVGDLVNPILYLKSMMAYMNVLHSGDKYSEAAHESLKKVYIALAQRTLREVTKEDEERFHHSKMIEGL